MQRFVISTALALGLSPTVIVPMAGAFTVTPEQPRVSYSSDLRIALKRSITTDAAERGFTVQVARGIGLVLNLSGLGEGIAKVWLSDPSKLVFSSQGSVIYLKPIQELAFAGNYHAADGSTLLTVVTQSGKVYQFDVQIYSGKPVYTSLEITPQGYGPYSSPYRSRYPSVVTQRPRSSRASTTARLPNPAPVTPKQPLSNGLGSSSSTRSWQAIRPLVPPTAPSYQAQSPVSPVPPVVASVAQSPVTAISPVVAPVTQPPVSPVLPVVAPVTQSPVSPVLPVVAPVTQSPVTAISPVVAPVAQPPVTAISPVVVPVTQPPVSPMPQPVPVKAEEYKPEAPVTASAVSPVVMPSITPQGRTIATLPTSVIANAIARGLPIAIGRKEIQPYSGTYKRVQSAIGLLRTKKVKNIPDAAKRTGLTVALLTRIETLGHRLEPSAYVPQAQPNGTPEAVPASKPTARLSQRIRHRPKTVVAIAPSTKVPTYSANDLSSTPQRIQRLKLRRKPRPKTVVVVAPQAPTSEASTVVSAESTVVKSPWDAPFGFVPYSQSLATVAPAAVPTEAIAAVTFTPEVQPLNAGPRSSNISPAALANAISRGLPVAIHNKRIRLYSDVYSSVQSAIRLLRTQKAKTLHDAATRAGVKIALLNQLHEWGTQQ